MWVCVLEALADAKQCAELCEDVFEIEAKWLDVKGNLHATYNDAFLLSLLEDGNVAQKEKKGRVEKVFNDMSKTQAAEGLKIESRMCVPIVAAGTAIVMLPQ